MKRKYTPLDLADLLKKMEGGSGKKNSSLHLIPLVGIILFIWAFIGGVSVLVAKYSTKPNTSKTKTTAAKGAVNDSQQLLERISAIYELPKGEVPTIATVSDKTKLQKQDFFIKAENGDRVLIYVKAKKAIIYRPTTNKIIEVAPLTLTNQLSPTQQPSLIPTVAITVSPTP